MKGELLFLKGKVLTSGELSLRFIIFVLTEKQQFLSKNNESDFWFAEYNVEDIKESWQHHSSFYHNGEKTNE